MSQCKVLSRRHCQKHKKCQLSIVENIPMIKIKKKINRDIYRHLLKGCPNKTSFLKIWWAIFSWTVGPRRLSFSGLGVLISTSSPEKDTLLAPVVHDKIAHEILKKEGFLDNPLKCVNISHFSKLVTTSRGLGLSCMSDNTLICLVYGQTVKT